MEPARPVDARVAPSSADLDWTETSTPVDVDALKLSCPAFAGMEHPATITTLHAASPRPAIAAWVATHVDWLVGHVEIVDLGESDLRISIDWTAFGADDIEELDALLDGLDETTPGWYSEIVFALQATSHHVPTVQATPLGLVAYGRADATPEGLAELARICGRIRTAPPGTRHDALLRHGRVAGGLAASGHVRHGDALAAVVAASIASGHDARDARTTGPWAIRSGLSAPIEPRTAQTTSVEVVDPVEVPLPVLPTPPTLAEAQAAITDALDGAMASWVAWQDARGGGLPVRGPDGKMRRPPRVAVPAPPPVLVRVGVGVGKSMVGIVHAVAAGAVLYIEVENSQLRKEIVDRLRAEIPGISLYEHVGRHAATEGEGPSSPGVCQKMSVVGQVGDARHSPAHAACPSCIPGVAAVCELATGMDARADAEDRLAALCQARHVDRADVDPCGYLLALATAKTAQVVVACRGSLSPSLAAAEIGGVLRDRLVISDESSDPYSPLAVGVPHIATWRTQIAELTRRADDPDRLAELRQIDTLFATCAGGLASAPIGATDLPPALETAWLEAADMATGWIEAAATTPTASWERVFVDWLDADASVVPLRALMDVATAIRSGTAEIGGSPACILASVPTPLTRAELAGEVQVIHLDATPPPEVVTIVEGLGGTIVDAIPDQPIRVELALHRAWGRGTGLAGREALTRQAKAIAALWESRPGYAVFCSKSLAHELAHQVGVPADVLVAAGKLGWFGAHDRGSNAYAGRNLIVVGLPIPPPDEERRAWKAYRALARSVGVDLPAWTDERGCPRVEIAPDEWGDSSRKWSADPAIRAWQFARASAAEAQTLGRARSLRNPGLTAIVLGTAVPIAQHGYRDIEVLDVEPVELGATRCDRNAGTHVDAHARICRAAMDLRADHSPVTRRTVVAVLHSLGLPAPSGSTWRAWLAKWGRTPDLWGQVAGELLDQAAALATRGVATVAAELLVRAKAEGRPILRATAELLLAVDAACAHRLERAAGPPAA